MLNVDSANITSQLAKVNANNEAIHNAFRNGWLWEVTGCVKINFLDALDKYED